MAVNVLIKPVKKTVGYTKVKLYLHRTGQALRAPGG